MPTLLASGLGELGHERRSIDVHVVADLHCGKFPEPTGLLDCSKIDTK
jgi:hypothetical protein